MGTFGYIPWCSLLYPCLLDCLDCWRAGGLLSGLLDWELRLVPVPSQIFLMGFWNDWWGSRVKRSRNLRWESAHIFKSTFKIIGTHFWKTFEKTFEKLSKKVWEFFCKHFWRLRGRFQAIWTTSFRDLRKFSQKLDGDLTVKKMILFWLFKKRGLFIFSTFQKKYSKTARAKAAVPPSV